MKRSETLQPLSREHHTALVYAKRLLNLYEQDSEVMLSYWAGVCEGVQSDLNTHFKEEEVLIQGINEPLLDRFKDEHRQLRVLMHAQDAEGLKTFAHLLKGHIRFEERELFPCLETCHYDILQRNLQHCSIASVLH